MSVRSLAVLLDILPRVSGAGGAIATAEQQPYRYQNYRYTTPIVFGGKLYNYAPFGVRSSPLVDLSLSGGDITIEMQNTTALDTTLQTLKDFQRATAIVRYIDPAGIHAPVGLRTSVSHATREGGFVIFTMRSPTNALQGSFTSKYFTSADFPELLVYKPRL